MFKISEPKSEPVLSKQPLENVSKLKVSRIGSLTKYVNRVLILTDNIQNYNEVSLLCSKTEFAVFNISKITERYCAKVSME